MKQLRPHQIRSYNIILDNISKGVKKQAIALPTGAGKSFLAAEVIKKHISEGGKVFFLVANQPLVLQTYKEFKDVGLDCGIIKSGMDRFENLNVPVQILMLQTYVSRLDKLNTIAPSLIIMDECDYCWSGGMIQKVFTKHPDAFFVGLSATIIDNKENYLKGFDFYDNQTTVKELQDLGYLAVDKNYVPLNVDLSNVRVMSTGEFNDNDLDEACNKNYIIEDIVTSYKKVDCGYKAICFAINIDHAEKLRDEFLRQGIKAGVAHSKQKKFLNDYWFDAHKKGRIQVLITIGMTIRGYSDVNVIDLIFTRPTNSLRLYLQAVGRAGRMDDKDMGFFRHFDYANNISRFGLWSENRLFSIDNGAKREYEHPVIVCPNCFSVIYERTGKNCPECDFLLKEQQEKREREIKETERIEHVVEIKALTGSAGAIESLTRLLGYNSNTFYYTKVLPVRLASVGLDVFNSEVIRIANYCRKKGYKPGYVVFKIREKMEVNNV